MRGLRVDVMHPLRQMGFHKPLLKPVPQNSSTSRKIFSAFSLVMALWNWLWKSLWNLLRAPWGRLRGAIRPPDWTRGGRSPDRRNATPRRSRDALVPDAFDVQHPGLAERPEGGGEEQALRRELAGVAQGVGVGLEAERAQFLVLRRAPRLHAPGGRCGAGAPVVRAGALERIGWANHGVPSAVLVAYLAT